MFEELRPDFPACRRVSSQVAANEGFSRMHAVDQRGRLLLQSDVTLISPPP